ncbi:LysR family transcriptional regulator [Polaromonas sp. A23]|uniref:LysR family transcriptional regulator n=1 Tax=Polaromonas sp. A23 TaxID=1944133 RepID=UPI00098627DD|nr:LysR family transcriptional regulator [Polaromonas sp. A23]OOG36591.1 LysR family transcriptional regulator [Polaromonas sp. A23]
MDLPYNLARFDLVSVKLAVACAQRGSLTRAAQDANLALAAASRRIRDLETAIGAPLFERHARGVRPTAAGRVFAKHGLTLLQTVERLGAELTDLQHGVVRHIRLCASTAAISQFLPALLAQYSERQPQVRVDLEEQLSEAAAAAMREGRCDLAIFVEGPDTANIETRLFREDELVIVLPKGHRLGGRSRLPFAQALDEDFISLPAGAAMLQQQQQAALAAGKPLRLRMQVRSFDAVCHLVASGMGLAVLPKGAALPMAGAMGLTWRPLADLWAQRRLLIGAARQPTDDAVNQLIDFLAEPTPIAKAPRRK